MFFMNHKNKSKGWQGKPIGFMLVVVGISSMSISCFFDFICLIVSMMGVPNFKCSCCNACDEQMNNTGCFSYGFEFVLRFINTLVLFFYEHMIVVGSLERRVTNGIRGTNTSVGYGWDCLSSRLLLIRLVISMWWGSLTQLHDTMVDSKGSICGDSVIGTIVYVCRMMCNIQGSWLPMRIYWIVGRMYYIKFNGKRVRDYSWHNIWNDTKGKGNYLWITYTSESGNTIIAYSILVHENTKGIKSADTGSHYTRTKEL